MHLYANPGRIPEAAEMLQLTLNEDVEADLKLTRLAEMAVNLDAAEAGQEVQKECLRRRCRRIIPHFAEPACAHWGCRLLTNLHASLWCRNERMF